MLNLIADELNTRHTIELGGRQCQIPMKILIIKQVMRQAMKGDYKSLHTVLRMIDLVERSEAARLASAERAEHRFTEEQLRKMSAEERTALYFQTIREIDGQSDPTEEETVPGFFGRKKGEKP